MNLNEPQDAGDSSRSAVQRAGDLPWCSGCGHRHVLEAVSRALEWAALPSSDTVVVTGMGCASLISFRLNAYGLHGLHGRALPLALGVKAANPRLSVIVIAGDGDTCSIGLGHVLHAARRNSDVTYLIVDNQSYGMTGGQPSPTAARAGLPSLNLLALLLNAGATFVAQAVAWEPDQAGVLIGRALRHRGFSVVNILSPCSTFGRGDEPRVIQGVGPKRDGGRLDAIAAVLDNDVTLVGILYEADRSSDHLTAPREADRRSGEDQSVSQGILDQYGVSWR